jgi:hypothetical protein
MNEDIFWEIISSFNWKKTGDDDSFGRLCILPITAKPCPTQLG